MSFVQRRNSARTGVGEDISRGRPSHRVDPAQRAELQVRLAEDQGTVGILKGPGVHIGAVDVSGKGTEHTHLEVRAAGGQELAVGGVEGAAQHGAFEFLLHHLADPP